MSELETGVVVTGTGWMGDGIGAIESTLERAFRQAQQEILLTVYAISSGADLLLEWLEDALTRGVQVRLIINRLQDQPPNEVVKLQHYARTYPYFYLYDFMADGEADLHAKAIVVDRRIALIGSSNLSRRGLLFNHELAILVHGGPAITTARAIDRLLASRYVVRYSG